MTFSSDTALLGVCSDASPNEIKAAYHELARKRHPDAGGSAEDFAELSNAYERLMVEAVKREAHCPECQGRGVIPLRSGFNSAWQACPRCKLARRA